MVYNSSESKTIDQWQKVISDNVNDQTTTDTNTVWTPLGINMNNFYACVATYLFVTGHSLDIAVLGFRYGANGIAIYGKHNQYIVRTIVLGG